MISEQEARTGYPFFRELTSNERDYFLRRGYRRLYFAENNAGEKVIWAHTQRGKPYGELQRTQMPWPVWAHPFRSYYKVGDLIQVGTVRRQDLDGTFPSLRGRYRVDSTRTLLQIVDYLVFGNRPQAAQYKIGYRIKTITPRAEGDGDVVLRGVIWHGRRLAYLPNEPSDPISQSYLRESFVWAENSRQYAGVADAMESYVGALMQVLVTLETGGETAAVEGMRGAAVGGARRLASRVGQRFVSFLEREAVQVGAKLLEAFLMGVAEDVVRQLIESRNHRWSDIRWDVALSKGASKAIETFFSEAFDKFTEWFGDRWAEFFDQEETDVFLRYLQSRTPDVKRYLAERFLEVVMVTPVQSVVQALVEGAPALEGDPANYRERVGRLLREKMVPNMKPNFRDVVSAMGSAITSLIGDNDARAAARDGVSAFAAREQ